MANNTAPVDDVLSMMQKGLSDSDIIRKLSEEGFSPVQITDALNQAKIKNEISGENSGGEMKASILSSGVPSPSEVPKPKAMFPAMNMESKKQAISPPATNVSDYPSYPYQYPVVEKVQQQPEINTEAIEEIVEEMVNEKWLEIKNKILDVIEWKTYAEKRILSVDDRIKRIENSLDRLQAALLSKVQEYSRNVSELGSEMVALEGAFGKILTPFVENMRELSKITGELKKTTKTKKS